VTDAAYEPGRTYEIGTFADLVRVHRSLPAERRELLLREVVQGVQYVSTYLDLIGAVLGGVEAEIPPLRWIDDDKGNADVHATFSDGETLTLQVRPDSVSVSDTTPKSA
jgi:hypothetical protein